MEDRWVSWAIKTAETERCPKEFQGVRGTELFKKSGPLKCDDYRGILPANHLAKLVLHQFLKPFKPVYGARIPVVQVGAVSKRGTDFGTQMLTSFIESRTNDNDSIGICSVDLVKAFDRVLRELVMGWPRSMARLVRRDNSCRLKRSFAINVRNMVSGTRCAFSLMMMVCAVRVARTSERGCAFWITSQMSEERTAEMYVTVAR